MKRFYHSQVNDSVHSSIHLSELECDIISTNVFQRLHNVKQLGLGVAVYPGANYSRFSHSLGACHVAGRIVDSIKRNTDREIDDDEKQLYRLGGLLHDVGHYPFSHSFEHASKQHYDLSSDFVETDVETKGQFYDHEKMGGIIIEESDEILEVFAKHDIDAKEVSDIFLRRNPGTLTAILSSDLDCDRLDYLMRTAHHAGLPYGNIDLDYIVNNITLDDQENVCLKRKALRAADHLLLSRYYDYTQLPFNKTVAALELSFEAIIKEFLNSGRLNCNKDAMVEKVRKNEWQHYDDQFIISEMRNALNEEAENGSPLEIHINAVLQRKLPKMVFSTEKIVSDSGLEGENLKLERLREFIPTLSEKFGIQESCWHIWSPKPLTLTKFGSSIPITEIENDDLEMTQLVMIKGIDKTQPSKSKPLVNCEHTLVNQLSGKKYSGLRLYVNLDRDSAELRSKIESYILSNVGVIQN